MDDFLVVPIADDKEDGVWTLYIPPKDKEKKYAFKVKLKRRLGHDQTRIVAEKMADFGSLDSDGNKEPAIFEELNIDQKMDVDISLIAPFVLDWEWRHPYSQENVRKLLQGDGDFKKWVEAFISTAKNFAPDEDVIAGNLSEHSAPMKAGAMG